MNPELAFDVIVLGSGSAGLMAALTAAKSGCRTLVLEKSEKLGGMTAFSGAGIWIPANHVAAAAGISDSEADALTYIRAASPEGWAESEDQLWQAFVAHAPAALRYIEQHTPLRFSLVRGPDVFLDQPGARAHGRMLSPRLLSRLRLREQRRILRSPVFPQLMTYAEAQQTDPLTLTNIQALAWAPRFAWRFACGYRGMGSALVIGLLQGVRDAGVCIVTDVQGLELLQESGRVSGVTCRIQGVKTHYEARNGVIIATGGFEWDDELRTQFFPGAIDFLTSPRSNSGDAVRLGTAVGAHLAHMDQANFNGAIPGRYEGRLQGIGWFLHHFPNSLVVDSSGKRFGNETDPNFFSLLNARDPEGKLQHSPAWLVSDALLFRKHRLARIVSRVDPKWIVAADNIEQLASAIHVPVHALAETLETFNNDSLAGQDNRFGRTRTKPISRPPFVAVPNNRSFMSTKGGPRTDDKARVLRSDGAVINGLFCAGVAMANPFGTRAISSGTTLGPNLTWGYIAGKTASDN